QFPYQTEVLYYITLFDNYENQRISGTDTYNVTDTRPPTVGIIQRDPQSPTQLTKINISINYVDDNGSGIANIFINYSLNGGIDWDLINITANGWGIIETQPAGVSVFYQIIATDHEGNIFQSGITGFIVQFNPTSLIIILVSIGTVTGISTYSGRFLYSKRKRRKQELQFLNEKEAFKMFFDIRLSDVEIVLSDINTI
ncbi:unnamed protein product, partial [marine sediment metagenome]